MSGTLSPYPWIVFDDNGIIVPGGRIHTYLAGTTDEEFVFTDAALLVAHTNPVIADSAGRAIMYLDAKSYRFIECDADDVPFRTIDPVQGTQAGSTNLGEIFTFGGDSTSPITVTSYPSGTTFAECHAGTSWLNLDFANLAAGTYKLEAMVQSVSGSVTVSAALVNLSDGADATALATCSSASTTGTRVQSGAITFAAAGAAKDYAIKCKLSGAGVGLAWGVRLVRTE